MREACLTNGGGGDQQQSFKQLNVRWLGYPDRMCAKLRTVIGAQNAAASAVQSANSVYSAESSSSSLWPPNDGQTTLSTLGSSLSTVSSTLSSVVSEPATTFHPTSINKPKSHVAEPKTAIGVVVPIFVVAVILFGLWAWWKSHRRFQSIVVEKRPATRPDEIQPYLQQKAELEDEASRRHELEALERIYEKDGNEILELLESSRQEMPERNSGCSMSI